MRRDGPATWLSLLAAVSLVAAGIFFCGYFGVFGPTLYVVRSTPIPELRSYSLVVDEGRVRYWAESVSPPPTGLAVGHWTRWGIRPRFPRLSGRLFWEFDFHSLMPPIMPVGSSACIVKFSTWCMWLPCLIAPAMWLWKRRRPMPVGFDVITDSRTQAGG